MMQKIAGSRWLPIGFRLLAVSLAVLHSWAAITASSMNADGINYLDMGEALWRGDWATAVNPVWSPLYGWLLGLVMRLVQPTMVWEFATIHLTNLAIFLFTLFAFERFWQTLRHSRPEMSWPMWAWWGLGYTLFIWGALNLIELWAVTPDMLMAAFVFLAAAQFLKIRQGVSNWQTFVLFGLFLGLGYLTKAIMLPVGLIFLFLAGIAAEKSTLILLSAATFLLISAPYITLISQERGHLNWGDAGTITYVRYVNGLPYPHWQGGPPENGTPLHPSRQILDHPPIYEFDGPIAGTYPISYDPVYWYEGVVTNFDPSAQIKALVRSGLFYFDLFVRQLGVWLTAVLLLGQPWRWRYKPLNGRSWLNAPPLISRTWGLTLVAAAALGAYSLVWAEGRYVAVFIILLIGELLSKMQRSDKAAVQFASVVMVGFMLLNIAAFNAVGVIDLSSNRHPDPTAAPAPSWPGETAMALHELGVQPGDKVGVVGYAFDSFWAKLADVQIVAELLDTDAQPFWLGDAAQQQRVTEAFAATGVKAIVAEAVPSYAELKGWQQVGNSSFYIYIIESE